MKRKPSTFLFAAFILLFGVWFGWRLTLYNAGLQIRHVFPGARPYFDPINSPDPTISAGIRTVIPSYFGMDEHLGFSLINSPEPLDLHQRFLRLSRLKLYTIHFTRCEIINLCPASGIDSFPGYIEFDDCDFSQLPPDQWQLLRPHPDPKKFYIGGV